ncbi:FAD-dependent oxidoreductase [Candidatus Gracilibacteria bacterium]|nr:FAD-dependent oxidoreductase [Candidatus Gracilibacteria bacterium]
MKKFQAKILEINKKTADISEFILGISEKMDFKNGQFLTIGIPHKKILERNGEKIVKDVVLKRAYSIVEIQDGKIKLWIKNVNGIGTKFLFSQKIGNELNIAGSFGNFFVKGDEENLIFMATGIGVPPIISHLKQVFEGEKKFFEGKKILFLYGVREKKDFFFEEILKKFSSENKNFSYKIFFSREEKNFSDEEKKFFEKGYFTKIFEDKNFPFQNSEFYFCGSVPLKDEILGILKERGIDEEKFVFEAY